jgi:two-component system cell cycle sensor histidine kinase/response regulator CckA
MNVKASTTDRAERALLDSELRLQQVLDNSSTIVFAKDTKGRYLIVNSQFESITGLDSATLLGRTDEQLFAPDLAARFRHNDLRVLHEGRSIEFEETADFGGGPRTFISCKFPLLDSNGAAYAVCGVATDITERKRLEDAFSAAALAVSQSEEDTLYRQLSRYLSTILGVDCAFIATTAQDSPCSMRMLAFCLDGETRENFTYPLSGTPCETVVGQQFRLYPSRLAETFPLDEDFRKLQLQAYAGHPLTGANGEPLGLIAVVTRGKFRDPAVVEATLRIFAVRVNAELQRAAATEALRTSEEQYRSIFNATTDAMILWDSQFRRVDVNAAYERTYGWSRDDVIGRGYDHPAYSAEYARPREDMVRRALAGEACHAELESIRKSGEHFVTEVQAIPFRHRGEPHVLAIARDVTERRQAEKERQDLETRLRQAQKMEAIGQLTGGIAHDFNNLLTSIMGYVTLAGERESALGDARLGGYLAQAQRSCERARDLIQQMLMFSRGHRGSPRSVPLAAVVRGAIATLRAGLPDTMEISADLDDQACPVHVDPAQVEQVLLNLSINARDAMGGSGSLRIGVRELSPEGLVCSGCRRALDGHFVALVVEDDGCGIEPEVVERIFEPFFSTKETGKGSGMGLAMVHGIVHEHGGHVVVQSSPGQGSRFLVAWPAIREASSWPGPGDEGTKPARPARPSLRGSVLVVDDEETVGQFMRELLETWGLQASCLQRPAEALEIIGSDPGRFDVVITDHSMPKMTGLELARRLRELKADLPVILYTGHGQDIATGELDAVRLCAVMRKPVDPVVLSRTLAHCLASRTAQ